MRHQASLSTFAGLLFFACLLATETSSAVPVYLKPESRFATGNHPRTFLEGKTKSVQFQRWFRVQTKDKAYGWIAEDHALTALRLVDQVSITEDTPSRTGPQMENIFGRPVLKKDSRALILEIEGSWARLQPLPASESQPAWVPTERLKPIFDGAPQRAFVYHTTSLRVDGRPGARALETLDEGTFVHVVRETPEWLEVRYRGSQGFIPKADAWRSVDLGEKGARPLIALAPLRSQPLPYADQIRALSLTSSMQVINFKTLRWGQVSLKDLGEAWWPMSDNADEEKPTAEARTSDATEKLQTSELFARKIFDMSTSKAIPSLKFVSAEGVFRTTDGETWTKIPLFKNENYPIAVASTGAIFIGPYVSDDHGETFQQWIRWDALVSALSESHEVAAKNLRIMEIKPEDAAGRKVTLRLNLGNLDPVRVGTDDQGASWRTF